MKYIKKENLIEYVEYINTFDSSWKLGKIYKVNENGHVDFESGNKDNTNNFGKDINLFKPSTKKAYDAQFVVKELEPLPQFKIIESIETITKVENNEGNQFFIGDIVKSNSGFVQIIKSFMYSLDKTIIVAETDICSQININKLEHYIEPEIKFEVGDKIQLKYVNNSIDYYLIITKIENDVIFFKHKNGYKGPDCTVLIKNAIEVN